VTPRLLEGLSDRSMPGRDRLQIGDWICRAADGVTGRANSCTPSGDPGLDVADAVETVEVWFKDRGLRPVFQVWDGWDCEVTEQLDACNYLTSEGADVFVLDLAGASLPLPHVQVDLTNGLSALLRTAVEVERLAELDLSALDKIVATIPDGAGGRARSTGVAVFDGSAVGVFAMATSRQHRRQGLAASVLSALLDHRIGGGAEVAWLQVMPSNEAAKPLYRRFGFQRAHAYHYRAAPSPES
jgi:ribosomal protein S18 acetylase RimI-like enzyme